MLRRPWGPRDQDVLDWVIAIVLAATGLADLIATRYATPLWLGAVITAATFLPLGVRRRYPVGVFVSVLAGSLVLNFVLQDPGVEGQYTFDVFLAWLLVAYSVAAHTSGRPYRLGIAAAVVGVVVWYGVALPAGRAPGNVIPAPFFCGIAWFAGRMMRRWRHLVADLADRTAELEREREHRASMAVVEERARIARELHDVVAHNVSVMVVQSQAGPRLLASPDRVLATFQAIESTGKDALVELRRLLGILRMDTPDLAIGPQPGVQSLGELAAQVEAAGLPVEVTVAGEPTVLPSGLDMTAYRIVQEALTNALRHAREATRAEVAVRYCASSVEIEITDDGSGSVTNGVSPGHGLIGMRERVGLYGGTLALEQPEAGGFRVRAVLPVASART